MREDISLSVASFGILRDVNLQVSGLGCLFTTDKRSRADLISYFRESGGVWVVTNSPLKGELKVSEVLEECCGDLASRVYFTYFQDKRLDDLEPFENALMRLAVGYSRSYSKFVLEGFVRTIDRPRRRSFLEILSDLVDRFHVSLLLVSSVFMRECPHYYVLYGGRILEEGSGEPLHPYSRLLSRPESTERRLNPPSLTGCPFRRDCRYAKGDRELLARCSRDLPKGLKINEHTVSCWYLKDNLDVGRG